MTWAEFWGQEYGACGVFSPVQEHTSSCFCLWSFHCLTAAQWEGKYDLYLNVPFYCTGLMLPFRDRSALFYPYGLWQSSCALFKKVFLKNALRRHFLNALSGPTEQAEVMGGPNLTCYTLEVISSLWTRKREIQTAFNGFSVIRSWWQ